MIRPILTEKISIMGEEMGKYAFVVAPDANKIEIKKAVEEMYDVTVASVNTMHYAGKRKSRNTRSGMTIGKTSSFKKAIITLAEGDTIDFYSNI
ncbi:MAG: 50S ribosomal protein L23 [Bacteroidota bacterium]|nr:50S ribosomal protein L23 [Bacteroidota bacterium]